MSNTQNDESPDEEAGFRLVIKSLSDRTQTRFCKKKTRKFVGNRNQSMQIKIHRYGNQKTNYGTFVERNM